LNSGIPRREKTGREAVTVQVLMNFEGGGGLKKKKKTDGWGGPRRLCPGTPGEGGEQFLNIYLKCKGGHRGWQSQTFQKCRNGGGRTTPLMGMSTDALTWGGRGENWRG